jgi:hypothetical protein
MNTISDFLIPFDPIRLSEMDKVQLLDRTDTKYIFHINQLGDILGKSIDNYRALTIKGMKYAHYETHYFDTPDYRLYTSHHNGRHNRYKVRFRTYVDSQKSFFEIKFKSNKGRTVKQRIQLPEVECLMNEETCRFLESHSNMKSALLQEALQINYNRIMLVNKEMTERLTIDFGMTYYINGEEHSFPNLVIAEVKQPRNGKSPFREIMHESHIRNLSISKYCLGIASFIPHIKKNAFKYKLLYINKISNAYVG